MIAIPKFKVVLLGASGVGKTTMVKRMRTGEFREKHIPTLGVEVTPLVFEYRNGEENPCDASSDPHASLSEKKEGEKEGEKEPQFKIPEEGSSEDTEEGDTLSMSEDKKNEIPTNKKRVIMNVWDCAGDDRFLGLSDGYWINADAFIIMFDVTSKSSLDEALLYKEKVKGFVKTNETIPILLLGNKVDRKMEEWEVDPKQGGFQRVSYKSNWNFEQPFLTLARKFLKDVNVNFY